MQISWIGLRLYDYRLLLNDFWKVFFYIVGWFVWEFRNYRLFVVDKTESGKKLNSNPFIFVSGTCCVVVHVYNCHTYLKLTSLGSTVGVMSLERVYLR
mgnify:CR=1 FL=1